MINISHNINVIFLMLGFSCNFKCKYCLQHEFKTKQINKTYNKDIIDFILQEAKKIKDTTKIKYVNDCGCEQEQEPSLQIHFFGGEPLLYIDAIKDIIEKVKYYNIKFSMITNGSLLTKELVEYFNENDVSICVSWDGRNTEYSRGEDVFKTNKDNIFKVEDLSISGIINSVTYPKDFFDDCDLLAKEFAEKENRDIGTNLDCLYNLNDSEKDIYNIDYDKIYNQVDEIAKNYFTHNNENTIVANRYIESYIGCMKNYQEYDEIGNPKNISACSNGYNVINMDLEGNLYLCHDNGDLKLGTIYSDYKDYMQKYKEYNKVPQFFKEHCVDCDVRFICNGGCMLVSEEERLNFYCKQRRATLLPIINRLLENYKDD